MDIRTPEPPRFWISFLRWFCPSNLYEGIEGDLLEQFETEVKTKGVRAARRRFIWQVIRFFRPEILLRHQFSGSMANLFSAFDLTKMYLQVAWRNFIRNRSVSVINVVGLSVSLAVGLLILLVIKNRLDFDTFHPDSDRLYRITTRVQEKSGERIHFATTPPALGPFLKEHFAFADEVVRVMPTLKGNVISTGGEIFVGGAYVDESFFRVLGFKLVAGNAASALVEPNSIVLTEGTARKIFGPKVPLGEILNLEGHGDFKVTGIIGVPRGPSEIDFGAYASLSTLMQPNHSQTGRLTEDWNSLYTTYTYVKIHAGTYDAMSGSLRDVGAKISSRTDIGKTYVFQANHVDEIPFSDVYLARGHSVQSLMILSLPGVILLLLAIFNYTNMTIARAFSRSKEIGVRKINGAHRYQLFFQLIVESVLVATIATVLASFIALEIPVNPSFERALPKTMDPAVIGWFLLFAIASGFLAGAFPAWVLSGIKPVQALKNNAGKISKFTWRKSLIVIQYTLSLAFLIVILVNYEQMQFRIESDYGFERENIIHVNPGDVNHNVLMTKIKTIPEIQSVSASSNPIFTWGNSCSIASEKDSEKIEYYSVDDEYLSVYGLELVAGENLMPGQHEQYILLNEEAADVLKLGSPQEALGQSLIINDTLSLQVRGVVKDFNAHPFKFAITPLALRYKADEFSVLNIKIYPSTLPEALKKLSLAWADVEPDYPLSYTVFADHFNERQAHKQDLKMMGSVSLLSIIISCLGLLGVVMYSTQTRMKEIGIRKAMGAFSYQIVMLISWTFLKLLLISACLAIPLGYWFGELILQQFAYRIELGAGIGFLGFAIMMTLSLVTIGSQTIRAGLRNPVEILRYE
jgi:putative ABC transport system permease protein